MTIKKQTGKQGRLCDVSSISYQTVKFFVKNTKKNCKTNKKKFCSQDQDGSPKLLI